MNKTAEELYKIGQLIAEGFIDRINQKNILEKVARKIEVAGRKIDEEQYARDLWQKAGLGRYFGLSDKEIDDFIRKSTSKKYRGKNVPVEEIIGRPLRPRLFARKPDITWVPRKDNPNIQTMVPSFYLKNK